MRLPPRTRPCFGRHPTDGSTDVRHPGPSLLKEVVTPHRLRRCRLYSPPRPKGTKVGTGVVCTGWAGGSPNPPRSRGHVPSEGEKLSTKVLTRVQSLAPVLVSVGGP